MVKMVKMCVDREFERMLRSWQTGKETSEWRLDRRSLRMSVTFNARVASSQKPSLTQRKPSSDPWDEIKCDVFEVGVRIRSPRQTVPSAEETPSIPYKTLDSEWQTITPYRALYFVLSPAPMLKIRAQTIFFLTISILLCTVFIDFREGCTYARW